MGKFFRWIGILLVLLIASILAAPGLIDWNSYRTEIEALASDALGRKVGLQGKLSMTLLPSPRFVARQVTLADLPREAREAREAREDSAGPMVSIGAIEMKIGLSGLLEGRLDINTIVIDRPEIRLAVLEDGRRNWELAPGGTPETGSTEDQDDPVDTDDGGMGMPLGIRLKTLDIRDGLVEYRDLGAGTQHRLDSIALVASARSLAGPFHGTGSFRFGGEPVTLDVKAKQQADRQTRVTLALGFGGAELTFGGGVVQDGATPDVRGRLTLAGNSLAASLAAVQRLAIAAGGEIGGRGDVATTPPAVVKTAAKQQSFSLEADLSANGQGVLVDDLTLALGDTLGEGRLEMLLQPQPDLTLAMKLGRLDLDALLAHLTPPQPAGRATESASTPTAPRSTPPGTPSAGAANAGAATQSGSGEETRLPLPVLPDGILARATVAIDALVWRGELVREVGLTASLENGVASIDPFSLLMPGQSRISLAAKLQQTDGKPQLEATVNGEAADLRKMLTWLEVPVASVPRGRLREAKARLALTATPEQVYVKHLAIGVDSTTAQASFDIAVRNRPAFGARVKVNKIDLDAYRPPASSQPGTQPDGAETESEAAAEPSSTGPSSTGTTSTGTSTPPAAPPHPRDSLARDSLARDFQARDFLEGLAFLDSFDANLVIAVGETVVNRQRLENTRVKLTLERGQFTVHDVQIQHASGGRAKMTGTARLVQPLAADLSLDASVNDPDRLFAALGILPPVVGLGPVSLAGHLRREDDALGLDVSLDALGGRAEIGASVDPLAFGYRMTLDADFGDGKRLVGVLAPTSPFAQQGLERLRAQAAIEGSLLGPAAVEGTVEALSVTSRFDGTVYPAGGPKTAELMVAVEHPELVTLIRSVMPGYRPAASALGPIKLTLPVRVAGEAISIDGIAGDVGRIPLSGNLSLASQGGRPKIRADLKLGDVDLDPLLPLAGTTGSGTTTTASAGTSGAGGTAGSGRSARRAPGWSREPIDLSALQAMDADIDFKVASLTKAPIRVDQGEFRAVLEQGTLNVKRLGGALFDGTAQASGHVVAANPLRFDLDVTANRIDLGKVATKSSGGALPLRGIFNAAFKGHSTGASQYDLFAALDGDGWLKVLDGALDGADLGVVGDGLEDLNNVSDFLSLVQKAQAAGSTRFGKLGGTIEIRKGVLRTRDFAMKGDVADGRILGTINLPEQTLALDNRFTLTRFPEGPEISVRTHGSWFDYRQEIKAEGLEDLIVKVAAKRLLKSKAGKQIQDKLGPLGILLDDTLTEGNNKAAPKSKPSADNKQTNKPKAVSRKDAAEKAGRRAIEGLLQGKEPKAEDLLPALGGFF